MLDFFGGPAVYVATDAFERYISKRGCILVSPGPSDPRYPITMLQLTVFVALALSLLNNGINATPVELVPRASCTISTYTDVSNVSGCTAITIAGQTVPAGQTLALSGLADGTTVTLSGNVNFATGTYWTGNLFSLSGGKIAFDGKGHTINGNGAWYCMS